MLGDFRELIFFLVNVVVKLVLIPLTFIWTVVEYGFVGFIVYMGVSGIILWMVVRKR
jgi:hypothetical protein